MKPIGNDIPNAVDDSSHPEKTLTIFVKTTVWRSFQVVFAPWKIPQIAMRCSSLYALLVGALALALEFYLILYVIAHQSAEPFYDWADYLRVYISRVFLLYTMFALVFFLILGALYAIIASINASKITLATIRAVLLTQAVLTLPCIIWYPAGMIIVVRHPYFSFFTIGKPEWIYWPIVDFLALFFLVGLIAMVGGSIVNAIRVRKLYRQKNSLNADSSVPK